MDPSREARFFTTILYKQGDRNLYSTRVFKPPKRKRSVDPNEVDFSGPEESETENFTTNARHYNATIKLHPAYQDPFYYPFDTREHDGPTIDINDPKQSRTAGLDPSDPIPAAPFPHNNGPRAVESTIHLPARSHVISALASMKPPIYVPGGDKKAHTIASVGGKMDFKGRNSHVNVLTTLMLRCIQEGDWERAGRAWAMLIRTAEGLPVDVRTNGMWGLGAEVLLQRSKEVLYPPDTKPKLKPRRRASGESAESEDGQGAADASGSESDREDDAVSESDAQSGKDKENDEEEQEEKSGEAPQSFFTFESFRQAREYYERLIVQHPQLRTGQKGILALDFYPAMMSLWVYEITQLSRRRKWELEQTLRHQQKDNDADADLQDSADEDEDETERDSRDSNTGSPRPSHHASRRAARRATRRTRRTQRHDRALGLAEVASSDLRAVRLLTARLDELLLSPPYDTNAALLELRGHIGVWIGDLLVDAVPPPSLASPPPSPSSSPHSSRSSSSAGDESDGEDDEEEEDEDEAALEMRDPEVLEARREARRERAEEMEGAREWFLKARAAGGRLVGTALQVVQMPYLGGRGAPGSSEGSEDGERAGQDVDMDG
ncbi:MAG: hypothetical protein Q9165_002532 [Trypethelium subeluteriae]